LSRKDEQNLRVSLFSGELPDRHDFSGRDGPSGCFNLGVSWTPISVFQHAPASEAPNRCVGLLGRRSWEPVQDEAVDTLRGRLRNTRSRETSEPGTAYWYARSWKPRATRRMPETTAGGMWDFNYAMCRPAFGSYEVGRRSDAAGIARAQVRQCLENCGELYTAWPVIAG